MSLNQLLVTFLQDVDELLSMYVLVCYNGTVIKVALPLAPSSNSHTIQIPQRALWNGIRGYHTVGRYITLPVSLNAKIDRKCNKYRITRLVYAKKYVWLM